MEAKISNAQIEVWEWKEKAYEQIKGLTKMERKDFIISQTKEMVAAIKAAKNKFQTPNQVKGNS